MTSLKSLIAVLAIVFTASHAFAVVVYEDNFDGNGGPLNGTTPDISMSGDSWVAAATFEDDGDSILFGLDAGGSATLAFTPVDGRVYTLSASIEDVTGDTDWFGLGFVNGQSTGNSGDDRFITGNVVANAFAMYRGAQAASTNQTFIGDTSAVNGGVQNGLAWLVDGASAGGSVAMRLTLDTTGGSGNWTVLMEADTGSGFNVIRAVEGLVDEDITAVGIANSNANDLTGTLTFFQLTDVPEPASIALLGLGGLMLLRRRHA